MPEGPEIRLAADRVERAVGGRVAEEVWCLKIPEAAELSGRRVERVETRGKAMLTHFEGGRVIYSHNQLYGRWYVKPAGQLAKTRRSLRLAIHTADKSALLYSASDIELLDADRLEEHPFVARLGPDVLDPEVTVRDLTVRLRDRRFAGRQLATTLLDQGFAAGLGNYLRSEILHTARIHPLRKPRDLTAAERRRLAKEVLRLPRLSYETRGITNDPRRVERLKAEGLTRRRYRFHVFQRAGRDCYRCGAEIVRKDLGGRAVFWCPGCQG